MTTLMKLEAVRTAICQNDDTVDMDNHEFRLPIYAFGQNIVKMI